MLIDLGCDSKAGGPAAILLIADDGFMEDGWIDVLGRMATGGAVETEDVGVETLVGDAAEAGLDTEPGES